MAKTAMDVANRTALDLDTATVDTLAYSHSTRIEYVAIKIQGLVRGHVNIGLGSVIVSSTAVAVMDTAARIPETVQVLQ